MDAVTVRFYPRQDPQRWQQQEVPANATLEDKIVSALRSVYDPELPVNIYDLGLVYGFKVGEDGAVDIQMTLTTPGCPVAGSLPGQVEQAVQGVQGITAVQVELVWEPAWTRDRISETAQLELGIL
jgi:FeS assembly SUF system protein